MWILFAFGSAIFSGLTTILAKCGIQKTDSTIATAIRTIIVLIFSLIMVCLVNSQAMIFTLSIKTWIFLILSGIATGASWLCYFKALQLGDVNKVVSIDKSSIVLTMMLALIIFDEYFSYLSGIGIILITLGTFLMIQKTASSRASTNKAWLIYAILSAIFASLTSILGKIGISDVEANLGTAIRTAIVLFMAWFIVFFTHKQKMLSKIMPKELLFICLSGVTTGAAWLCFYKALQIGPASVIVPIDKLSILVSIFFSYFVFKERLSLKASIGLFLIVFGTFLMIQQH